MSDPWEYWSPEQMAAATRCSASAIEENWPHIHYALLELGIADRPVQMAVIATIAVETASTFRPIHEYQPWPSHYDGGSLYHGRGYIQLTHLYNYLTYGELLGVDLVNNPDSALDASVAAWVLAYYFRDRGVADAARLADWPEVRRRVQGAYAGLERLEDIVGALVWEEPAAPLSEVDGLKYALAYLADDVCQRAATSRLKVDRLAAYAEAQRVREQFIGSRA